jgi:integrase
MVRGERHRVSLDKLAGERLSRPRARALAQELATKIRKGEWPPAPVAPQPQPVTLTVDEAMPKYLVHVASPHPGRHRKGEGGRKADESSDRSRAKMILCHWFHEGGGFRFGTLPLDQLRAYHVETIVTNDRVQGRPASTINKVMLLLRGFCRWLHAKGYVNEPILASDSEVMRREQETKRSRRLAAEERERLLAQCRPWLRTLVEAALETACRLGELLGLTWEMVDLDKRMITLPASLTKTSQSRAIPITTRLEALLRMRRHDPAGEELSPTARVFGDELGNAVGSIKKAWRTATRKAGISNLRFHDLRRKAASTLLERGIPLHFVSKILGHSNVATTSIYLSASGVDLRNAFDEMERREREAAEGQQQRPPAQANPDDTPIGMDRSSHAANADLSARCTTAIN